MVLHLWCYILIRKSQSCLKCEGAFLHLTSFLRLCFVCSGIGSADVNNELWYTLLRAKGDALVIHELTCFAEFTYDFYE